MDDIPLPTTLAGCVHALGTLLSEEDNAILREYRREELPLKTHFILGLWIRNTWLYSNPVLCANMSEAGYTHEDSMSAAIVQAYWESLGPHDEEVPGAL